MKESTEKHAAHDHSMQPATEEKGDVLEVTATYTPEEERQVLRKIDRTILPLICIVFFMQVSDTKVRFNLCH
jgi:hypothetical protein